MANVKCGFSEKYRPLLQAKLNEGAEEFTKFVNEYFTDPDTILKEFLGGISTNTAQAPKTQEITQINSRTGRKIDTTQNEVSSYYRLNPNNLIRVKNGFRKSLISFCIYDMDTKEFVKETDVVGDSETLNDKIFEYKVELLRKLDSFTESAEDLKNKTPQELYEFFNNIIINFEASINNDRSDDPGYSDKYNAYVILKTFDNFLENYAPFIQVKPEYKNSYQHIPGRYVYKGPSVQHYTGWSTNEFADQAESISDLAKILLNYFPEVDNNGNIIANSSITLPGFNSVMSKVKSWIDANRDTELDGGLTIQNLLDQGVERDMGLILNAFKNSLGNLNIRSEYKTYLINKLNGIINFLYAENMPQHIKNMFTHLMDKTVQSDYIGYKSEKEKVGDKWIDVLRPVMYTERPVKLQADALKNLIESASYYWNDNKKQFIERLEKYGITYNVDYDYIEISNPKDASNSITIEWNSNGEVDKSSSKNIVIPNFENLLSEFACVYYDEAVENLVAQMYPNGEHTVQSLYLPIIANIIRNGHEENVRKFSTPTLGELKDLGRILSITNGSDLKSVIKNGEGNNLPLYQQVCLAYRPKDVIHEIKRKTESGMIHPYNGNLIFNNSNILEGVSIRTDVTVGDTTKNCADLPEGDIMAIAIGQDFIKPLLIAQSHKEDKDSATGIIGLQMTTYSDKNKHFIMKFNIGKEITVRAENGEIKKINIQSILMDYIKNSKSKKEAALKPLIDAFYYGEQYQISTIVSNIVDDYNSAGFRVDSEGKVLTPEEIKTLSDSKKSELRELETLDNIKALFARGEVNNAPILSIVKQAFRDGNIDFIEEFHASRVNKVWTVNETLEFMNEITQDRNLFDDFLNKQYEQFRKWSADAFELVRTDSDLKAFLNNNKNAKDEDFLRAYFLTDTFLSNHLSQLLVGYVFAHPNKNTESYKKMSSEGKGKDYFIHSLSSRWTSQVKRMVILGATYHSYAQGMKYGVPKTIKMAVMPDEVADVFNYFGAAKPIDANDGSGLTSPHFSRMQNVSLIDASVGGDKKTIYHDINPRMGLPMTLKWAEYEITNESRRNSVTTSLENLYWKMHNLKFDKNINYEQSFDNLYYEDPISGKLFKINSIEIVNGIATRVVTEVNESGFPGEQYVQTIQEINKRNTSGKVDTIYDIDQLFGGAWAKTYNENTSSLQYTESNLDLITKFICDEELRDYMIGWVVNKSAIKVGSTNINDESAWSDSNDLWYTEMSTQFGGLQMNADHEYEDADVTEPSQMISALEQNGYTHDLATRAYQAIGKIVYDSVSDITNAFGENDLDTVYKIYGKAVVQSFASGERETLGLAQSFIRLADKAFQENNLNYRIPASSASINGIFNSTVTSALVKRAIRRHYAGISAVLHPAYNTQEHFKIGGNVYRYQDAIRLIRSRLVGTPYEGRVEEFFKSPIIETNGNKELSPFTEEVTLANPIDFEDTIVIIHEPVESGYVDAFGNLTSEQYSQVKINSIEKYDKYKHAIGQNPNIKIYRWQLASRNLKGSDTKFTFISNGVLQTASVLDTDEAITIRLLKNVDWSKRISGDNKKLSDSRFIFNQLKEYCDATYGQYGNNLLGIASRVSGVTELSKDGTIEIVDTEMNISIVTRNLKRRLQKVFNALSDAQKDPNKDMVNFTFRGKGVIVTDVKVSAAQIMMGKLYAKQLGLLPGDSLTKIRTYQDEYTEKGLAPGVAFFRDRIAGYYRDDNYDYKSYDWVLFDGTGNKLYVKLDDGEPINNLGESKYRDINDGIYFEDRKVCANAGKKFYTYYDSDGVGHQLCVVKNVESFKDLESSGMFSMTQRNYRPDNYQVLAQEEYPNNNMEFIYQKGKKTYSKLLIDYYEEISNADTTESKKKAILNLVQVLTETQTKKFERKLQRQATDRYESLEKSLRFIGTRIPCQNMTSFAAMEVIEFTDDEVNRIYLPPVVTYMQGSDFDEVTSK